MRIKNAFTYMPTQVKISMSQEVIRASLAAFVHLSVYTAKVSKKPTTITLEH